MKEAFEKIRKKVCEMYNSTPNYMHKVCGERKDGECSKYIGCEECLIEKVFSIVSEVEAEYGNGWIDVKDRLPENDDDVLVWYRYRMMQGVNIVGSKEQHGIGHYYEPTDSWLIYGGFGLDQNVIAWMPLPSPYTPTTD